MISQEQQEKMQRLSRDDGWIFIYDGASWQAKRIGRSRPTHICDTLDGLLRLIDYTYADVIQAVMSFLDHVTRAQERMEDFAVFMGALQPGWMSGVETLDLECFRAVCDHFGLHHA